MCKTTNIPPFWVAFYRKKVNFAENLLTKRKACAMRQNEGSEKTR